ncbi:hypothetical protein PPERSA_08556 [Pseudocohnilembus persalinus]|uniref:Hydroxysteroid dehydrogenase-like protein 2 n=1 Tax=Pseudocohnilembus persalinus TaxID=266149 RepID=A0A0V0R6P6_PSEPJ|nr:hypothetical protein PPERSA_08556 [Pseudocohnilembus persalinus]|eukprot:KRX10153.1 hypothetical protein PPERSA_08556 [Pseudocohnilembus persalinus]
MNRLQNVQKQVQSPGFNWAMHQAPSFDFDTEGSLKDKVLVISGASRGIGLAIGKRAAKDGAKVAILAKTAEAHPKLPGTIHTAAKEIEELGGKALPIQCDIRYEDQVKKAIDEVVKTFGGIDIVINNASAISLTGTLETDMKRYDLMHQINTRGTYLLSKICIPYLLKSKNPHILNLSPPLNMEGKWFGPHVAYSMAKFGMSMCVLGMAHEFQSEGISVNALWPRTAIATSAVKYALGGDESIRKSRTDQIMSDSAHVILTQPKGKFSGNFFIDDEVMLNAGVQDLTIYKVDKNLPDHQLMPDFFV